MTIEVGDIIKSFLADLTFIDKLAGVVRVVTRVDLDENNKKIIKKFPVACNVTSEDCASTGIFKDLVPDSSKGCIVFLEDQGIRFIGMRGHKQQWKAAYKIIGWVNNAKLGYADCSITGKIVASIINKMPLGHINSGNYQSVGIQILGQEPKTGQNPFSKYTFTEEESQYLFYPFDYFSLPVEVSFEIDKRCIVDFEAAAAIPCK